jgi:hypothetical protein
MDQVIDITVLLQVAAGHAGESEAVADAIAADTAAIEGFAMTRSWEQDGRVLALHYRGEAQHAVDRHLAEHGPRYGEFAGHGEVVRVTVAGPADKATIAAFQRLSGTVERR